MDALISSTYDELRLINARLDEAVTQAIELSVTKYCSVRDSLDPDIPIHWSLELEP